VYHGVATGRFRPAPRAKVASESAKTATPIRMISVGRLVEKKGFCHLIRACALLRERGNDFALSIYGTGPQRDELARLIETLGVGDIVKLQGSRTQKELMALYREADLFVLSPYILESGDRDGIPNVLMEAMAVGLPAVATDVSGIPELIEHERSGLLVPPRDEVALAAALERLLDPAHGPGMRARLGFGGRRRVVEHFDANLHLRRMVELLDTRRIRMPSVAEQPHQRMNLLAKMMP
jgi:glycosyltransferase involved in cell wall biosynthesis